MMQILSSDVTTKKSLLRVMVCILNFIILWFICILYPLSYGVLRVTEKVYPKEADLNFRYLGGLDHWVNRRNYKFPI